MHEVTIYGASDDLIEVEGAFSEEFNHYYDDKTAYLHFDNGTIVGVKYTDWGVWRIELIAAAGAVVVAHKKAPDEEDDCYSDRLTLKGNFNSVMVSDSKKFRTTK